MRTSCSMVLANKTSHPMVLTLSSFSESGCVAGPPLAGCRCSLADTQEQHDLSYASAQHAAKPIPHGESIIKYVKNYTFTLFLPASYFWGLGGYTYECKQRVRGKYPTSGRLPPTLLYRLSSVTVCSRNLINTTSGFPSDEHVNESAVRDVVLH